MNYYIEADKFRKACGGGKETTRLVTVISKANKDSIINDYISVSCLKNPEYLNINIQWEDSGYNNYKDLGLYGYYSSKFCKMKYNAENKFIDIYSGDLQIIINI